MNHIFHIENILSNDETLVLLPVLQALLWFLFYRPGNKPAVDPGAINTEYLPLCLTRSNLHCPGGYEQNVNELLSLDDSGIHFHPVSLAMWKDFQHWILFKRSISMTQCSLENTKTMMISTWGAKKVITHYTVGTLDENTTEKGIQG